VSDPRRPRAETLAWVERTLGAGARVVRCRRLTGGIASTVHQLDVEHAGRRRSYVLRWWSARDVDRTVAAERAVLAALEGSGVPAPRAVGATEDPALGPALLMTRLPGRVELVPRDRERWLDELAGMLARIHALQLDAKPFEPWLDPARLAPPPDARRPAVWREAFRRAAAPAPPTRARFVHRDYQHFNVLWSRGRLTGVVDWGEACRGPADVDVGHCRLNLALLFSAELAERFRRRYEAEAAREVDPWWDLHALLSYGPDWRHFLPLQIDGRAPLEVDGMTSRIEDVLDQTLRRL
jgi:aminoglycoside phosphotransferase (APT) family kinase protein